MKIITIIGARPQFIKAAVVSDAIQKMAKRGIDIQEAILHTGQHYDANMSDLFFRQLNIPEPKWHLNCGNNMEEMKASIRPILETDKPDIVIVYGDTNSTLAGAETAHSLQIPVAHIEAGLRSFNDLMPEERNRILTDRISTWLFCPTQTAVDNLHNEGYTNGIHWVGDVMYDAALHFTPDESKQADILSHYGLESKHFILATMHRASTAENEVAITHILQAFKQTGLPVLLPLHPHTAKTIKAHSSLQQLIQEATNIRIIEPVGYIETLALERHAKFIMTDSGGMQKEAYFQRTPCITLREETEWTETIKAGWNRLAGTDTEDILRAINTPFEPRPIDDFGDGMSASHIANILWQSEY